MRAKAHTPIELDEAASGRNTKLRDRRIGVSAITRARTADGERTVRIVGLSARTALLVATESLGFTGQCVDLDVPVVGGRDLSVMGGIARSERCKDGWAVTVEFVVVEGDVRRQLNELLALLLAGDLDDAAQKERVVYDVVVGYGPTSSQRGHLQEISLSGLSMRVHERMAHDFVVAVAVPSLRGPMIGLRGRVTGQRLSAEDGYITAVDFEPLDGTRRHALGALVADLMCR